MRISTAVVYKSPNNPRVQVEFTPRACREVLDGHEKTITAMCVEMEKSLQWITENSIKG